MGVVVPDWLGKRATLSGEHIGLEVGGSSYTFAQINRDADRVAQLLAAHNVGPEARVALLIPNGPHFVWCIHAASRLGAVSVPLNLRLTRDELSAQLKDAEVSLLVYHSAYRSTVQALLERTAANGLCIDEAWPGNSTAEPIRPVTPRRPGDSTYRGFDLDQVHTIIFTSGTTGRPKGAMLTYGNHWWSAMGSVLNLGLEPTDKWLACVPLFHVSGLSILMRSVIYGMTALIHERFDPELVNRAIDQDGVTIISVVSSMLGRMLDARGDRPYPDSLRCVLVGGGPVPGALLERCRRLGVPVVQTYGLSETGSQVVTLSPQDAMRKLGSAGRPLFPVELRIDTDGREAKPNEAGEITIKGPNVMAGYYKRPDATAHALRDGWLHTGDVGYVDDEGYLYVLDRRDDLIISGGENIYPAEVEAVLMAHPGVEEAAVVGKPDPAWGAVPVAFVKLRAGQVVSTEALVSHCKERLAAYKVPKSIAFEAQLPRNASGKLLRKELRERFHD